MAAIGRQQDKAGEWRAGGGCGGWNGETSVSQIRWRFNHSVDGGWEVVKIVENDMSVGRAMVMKRRV